MPIVIDITAPEGNAYAVMGRVRSTMQLMGISDSLIEQAMERMRSGNYDHLCTVASEVTNGLITFSNTQGEYSDDD